MHHERWCKNPASSSAIFGEVHRGTKQLSWHLTSHRGALHNRLRCPALRHQLPQALVAGGPLACAGTSASRRTARSSARRPARSRRAGAPPQSQSPARAPCITEAPCMSGPHHLVKTCRAQLRSALSMKTNSAVPVALIAPQRPCSRMCSYIGSLHPHVQTTKH